MKPKVIRKTGEKVEKTGLYWRWCNSHDKKPDVVNKEKNSYFHGDFTYQEYQGEVPEFPREKTDKEKLNKLIAAAEIMLEGRYNDQVDHNEYSERIDNIAALVDEFKELK